MARNMPIFVAEQIIPTCMVCFEHPRPGEHLIAVRSLTPSNLREGRLHSRNVLQLCADCAQGVICALDHEAATIIAARKDEPEPFAFAAA